MNIAILITKVIPLITTHEAEERKAQSLRLSEELKEQSLSIQEKGGRIQREIAEVEFISLLLLL